MPQRTARACRASPGRSCGKPSNPLPRAVALARDRVDLSLPGVARPTGSRTCCARPLRKSSASSFHWASRGRGSEIETPYYNFEALNIPNTIRRTPWTLSISRRHRRHASVLRTHTSPMQIRTMEKQAPPVRIIVRARSIAATTRRHALLYFHQVEAWPWTPTSPSASSKGPWNISSANSLGHRSKHVCDPATFLYRTLGRSGRECFACGGSGCRLCKFSDGSSCLARHGGSGGYGFVNYDAKRLRATPSAGRRSPLAAQVWNRRRATVLPE